MLSCSLIAVAFFSQVVSTSNAQQIDGVVSLTSRKTHPNLYFSTDDISRLRDRIHNSHAGLYQRLSQVVQNMKDSTTPGGRAPPVTWQEYSATWNEVYGNNLVVLAMYCALTPSDHRARDLVKLFMTRLASYPNWLVKGKERDDVPVAHSLLGFATAFDFLYGSFTPDERVRYLDKMHKTGEIFYKMSLLKHWGNTYIHNHVATNYVALLATAIVIKPHFPQEADTWSTRSVSALNKTMSYLKLVVDGSFEEGVSYGTYTMRSLIQFIFLTKRHMNYSYASNNWLHEHFNFMLHSVLPGFQRTFGIADSVQDWAYTPEGVLVFLEGGYVLHKGSALWLANRIKKHRTTKRRKDVLVNAHNSILTEFLFYNETAKEFPSKHPKLYVFSDFGVITYGGGTPAGHVFLSFKCGRLQGRAINMLWPKLSNKVQNGFRLGHEHPDQGSFVFIAKEQAVITESFYSPKFTFLENTLMFGPGQTSRCPGPCEGQVGEGFMWFNYLDNRVWQAHGDLVGYSRHGDIIFMSGDMTGWYDQSLGLDTVYRALVMLSPSVLVVIDTVRLRTTSPTTHVSTFFHNVDLPFKKSTGTGELPCAMVGRYSMCWAHHNSHTVNVETMDNYRIHRARYPTNFINITWHLLAALSSTAYVFHGPYDTLHAMKVSQTLADGISVSLQINSTEYDIILSTRHSNPRFRRNLLGSSGYGILHINHSMVLDLGVKGEPRSVPRKASFLFSLTERDNKYMIKVDPSVFLYAPVASLLVLVGLFLESMKRAWPYRCIRCTMFALFVVGLLTLVAYLADNENVFETTSSSSLPAASNEEHNKWRHMDAVMMTGLPLSGREIAQELFTTNTDFVVIGVPSEDVVTPSEDSFFNQGLDLCEWRSGPGMTRTLVGMNKEEVFTKWWEKLVRTPLLVRKNMNKENISICDPLHPRTNYWVDVIKSQGALAMVYFNNPGWLFRVSWFNSKFSRNSFTPMLYVVRDPRSWIEHLLSQDFLRNAFLQELEKALKEDLQGIEFSSGIRNFQEVYDAGMPAHVVLAHVWDAFFSYASELEVSSSSELFRIVRFEDLLSSPKATSEGVYDFLRMPFSAAVEHRILQVTKSGVFSLHNYGVIDNGLTTWGKFLANQQVLEIETICRRTMVKIGYLKK